jgi:hypothetical protein
MTTDSGSRPNRSDIQPGAQLISLDTNIRCTVDRKDGDTVHMRVTNTGETYNGKREFTQTMAELTNSTNWTLAKQAA